MAELDVENLRYHWDDLRVFLAAAETGSLRSAADELNLPVMTVKGRIDGLEHRLRVTLFIREPAGLTLTPDGASILNDARMIADSFRAVERKIGWSQYASEGTVSIATTDGLGTYWIAPKLIQFQRANPNIRVHLKCSMELPDVIKASSDVMIQYTRPTARELKIVKLGTQHFRPYASKEYWATYGMPTSKDEKYNHRYVVQVANQLDESLFLQFIGADTFTELSTYQANTSTSHYAMIVAGLGIGALPTYLGDNSPELVALPMPVDHKLDIYMTFRPAIAKAVRVRRTINWLKGIFDWRQYPQFSSDRAVATGQQEAASTEATKKRQVRSG
jgi:DNA-binding transcriptional LysR family regulator